MFRNAHDGKMIDRIRLAASCRAQADGDIPAMNDRRKTRRKSYRIAQVEQAEAKGSIQVIERMMSLVDALASASEPLSLKALSKG